MLTSCWKNDLRSCKRHSWWSSHLSTFNEIFLPVISKSSTWLFVLLLKTSFVIKELKKCLRVWEPQILETSVEMVWHLYKKRFCNMTCSSAVGSTAVTQFASNVFTWWRCWQCSIIIVLVIFSLTSMTMSGERFQETWNNTATTNDTRLLGHKPGCILYICHKYTSQ